MRFCPWYPLSDAAAHAPAAEGVLQIRLADGLVDYPSGKSAMVHYEHAHDVRAAAVAFAATVSEAGGRAWKPIDLVCRHLDPEGDEVDLVAFHARVLDEFVRRFGAAPSLP